MAREKKYIETTSRNLESDFLKAMSQFYGACIKIGTVSINDWVTRAVNKSIISHEKYQQIKQLVHLRYLLKNNEKRIPINEAQISLVYKLVKIVYESKNRLLQERRTPGLPDGSFRVRVEV
jgi:hypothetical protein